MLQNLDIALVQTDLYWEDKTANLAMLEEKIATLTEPVDLIILPEMFSTGFTMNPANIAEHPNHITFKWLHQMATQTKAVIVGSYVVKDNGQYFNRLIWIQPDGSFDYYDKRHLFRMAGEDNQYAAGTGRIIKTLKGWRICPLICYDLRFPVWSRNVNLEYDLLLYVANWPAVRSFAWNTLLQARAIENLSYVVGVNRVGNDSNDIPHSGDSSIVNYMGEVLLRKSHEEGIYLYQLNKQSLEDFRKRFPAHLDADKFNLML